MVVLNFLKTYAQVPRICYVSNCHTLHLYYMHKICSYIPGKGKAIDFVTYGSCDTWITLKSAGDKAIPNRGLFDP